MYTWVHKQDTEGMGAVLRSAKEQHDLGQSINLSTPQLPHPYKRTRMTYFTLDRFVDHSDL